MMGITRKKTKSNLLLEEIGILIEDLSAVLSFRIRMNSDEYKCKYFHEWDEKVNHLDEKISSIRLTLENKINDYLGTEHHKFLVFHWEEKSSVEKHCDGIYEGFLITIPKFDKQEYYCLKIFFDHNKHLIYHYRKDHCWWIKGGLH